MSDFDLASAKPVEFDLGSAKPVGETPGLGFWGYLKGVPGAAASIGTGAVASLAGGLSSAGTLVGNAGNAILNRFGANLGYDDPAENFRKVQTDLTYKAENPGAQALLGKITYPSEKLAQFANYAGGQTASGTGSPALGAAVNTGIQALPYALGARFAPKAPVAAPAAAIAPEVAEATQVGLKLTPQQAGGLPGQIVQSLSGSAKLERSLSKQNAPIVNDLAAQEIGLPKGTKLTPQALSDAKAPSHAVYNAAKSAGEVPLISADFAGVKSAGTLKNSAVDELRQHYSNMQSMDAKDLLADVAELRASAGKNIRAPFAPAQNALGYAQKQMANALENALGRKLNSMGKDAPTSLEEFQNARAQLAKIHSVEDSLIGSNVSAKSLASEPYLSGNLRTIANAYNNFDRSLQDVSKIRDSGPFGVLDLGYGALALHAHPLAVGAVLSRPLARAALASKAYQSRLAAPPVPFQPPVGLLGPTAPLLTQQPAQQ